MGKYLEVSYYTLTGIRKLIDLGDFAYGEWIIYNGKIPQYHVHSFSDDTSNSAVSSLLDSKTETIESIIKKINASQNTQLNQGRRPLITIVKKEEVVELELPPLPEHWIKNIS